MKPFYQGKVDTFCAIYAVLNALRLTHGLRTLKARAIFNATLLDLCQNPKAFQDVLEQNTDYLDLVDSILRKQSSLFPMRVSIPYRVGDCPSAEELWRVCQKWMVGENRAVILRFTRNLTPDAPPVVRHWSTIDRIDDEVLHLFDCSHDAEAIVNIRKGSFVTLEQDISKDRLIRIQPESLRFVRLPF